MAEDNHEATTTTTHSLRSSRHHLDRTRIENSTMRMQEIIINNKTETTTTTRASCLLQQEYSKQGGAAATRRLVRAAATAISGNCPRPGRHAVKFKSRNFQSFCRLLETFACQGHSDSIRYWKSRTDRHETRH